MKPSIAAIVGLLLLPGAAEAGGTVGGLVTYQGSVPSLKHRPITVDAEVCGRESVSEDFLVGNRGVLKNAVVYLEGPVSARAMKAPAGGFAVEQKGCRFEPHIVIVPAGVPLTVRNSDGILHNFHARGRTNPPRSEAQPASQREMTVTFDHPEFIHVTCDVHPWMDLWVVAAANAYYVVTDKDGRYRLEDVPAGDYNLVVWHELLGTKARRITVREGEHLPFDVRLERPALRVSYEDRLVDVFPP